MRKSGGPFKGCATEAAREHDSLELVRLKVVASCPRLPQPCEGTGAELEHGKERRLAMLGRPLSGGPS